MIDFFPVQNRFRVSEYFKTYKLNDNLPEHGGVFIIISQPASGMFEPIFIGTCDNLREELTDHPMSKDYMKRGATAILFLTMPMAEQESKWEELLLSYPKTPLNANDISKLHLIHNSTDVEAVKSYYGEDFYRREQEFKSAILEIEAKHIDYFRSKTSPKTWQPHDRLENHVSLYISNGTAHFKFEGTPDMPPEIGEKCQKAFSVIMGDK